MTEEMIKKLKRDHREVFFKRDELGGLSYNDISRELEKQVDIYFTNACKEIQTTRKQEDYYIPINVKLYDYSHENITDNIFTVQGKTEIYDSYCNMPIDMNIIYTIENGKVNMIRDKSSFEINRSDQVNKFSNSFNIDEYEKIQNNIKEDREFEDKLIGELAQQGVYK